MKTLVIYTYPHRQSLNGAFLEKTLEGLHQNPVLTEVRVLDLYGEGFDPVLVFNAEKRRRDLYHDPEMESARQLTIWADLIVFIYPIWWGRPPAMLLGFIDRLMATNFAYRNIKGSPLPEGLLKGKSIVCVSTMKGPAGYLQYWLYNAHQVLLRKAVFNFVGIKKVKFFEFPGMEKPNGNQVKYLDRIQRYFRNYRATRADKIPESRYALVKT